MEDSYERRPQRYEQQRRLPEAGGGGGRHSKQPTSSQQQQQSRDRTRRKPPSIHTSNTREEFPADEERSPRVVTPQQYHQQFRGSSDFSNHRSQPQQRRSQHQHPLSRSQPAFVSSGHHMNTSASTTGSRSSLQHAPSFYSEFSAVSSPIPVRRGRGPGSGSRNVVLRKEVQHFDPTVYSIDRAHTESTQGMTSCSGDDTFRDVMDLAPPPPQQRYPPEEQMVRVFIGEQSEQQRPYYHSRWMLTYASPVLKQCLAQTDSITFPHANPLEWEQLVAFIEPATKRNLTKSNVPLLLPWFHELDLRALLVECDAFLLPYCQPSASSSHRRHHHDDDDDDSEGTPLQPLDALRLCAIGLRVGRLRRTRQAAHAVAARLLTEGVGDWEIALLVTVSKLLLQSLSDAPQEGEDSEDEDEDDSQRGNGTTASQVLRSIKAKEWFETSAAADLFIAYLRYLPGDCIVDQLWATNHSQISRLLQNPVVPYLVRQGMEEKQSRQRNNHSGIWPMFSKDQGDDKDQHRVGGGERGESSREQSAWLERVWKHLNRPPLVPVVVAPTTAAAPPLRNFSVLPPPQQQPPRPRNLSVRPQQRPSSSAPSATSAPHPPPHRTFAC